MSRSKKVLMEQLSRLSPRAIQHLIGMSLALDPAPCRRYETFLSSDAEALLYDWIAVGGDFRKAISQNVGEENQQIAIERRGTGKRKKRAA